MSCGKCGKGMLVCPVSLGLSVGVTCGLMVLFWTAWAMYVGVSMESMSMYMPPKDWMEGGTRAFWCLLKGFAFGFFVGLIYDFCISRCPGKCCKSNGDCSCCNGKAK